MAEIWGGAWRAQTSTVKYPFADRATLSNGPVFLPEGAILDAVLHPPGSQNALYLSSAVLTSETVKLYFGDEANKQRCSGTFVIGQESDEIRLLDAGGFAAGVLIIDPIQFATVQSWGDGEHLFTRLQMELVPSVCLPTPEAGVRRISIEGHSLAGEAWFIGDDGVVLTVEDVVTDDATHPVIRVNAVGDPLERRRLCEPRNLYAAARPIRTIRFVDEFGGEHVCTPDNGEVSIVVGDHEVRRPILRFLSDGAGLEFRALGSLD